MLESVFAGCPYCGERIELLIDCSQGNHDYIEDCSVCCCPIIIAARLDADGQPSVQLYSESGE